MTLKSLFAAGLLALPLAGMAPLGQPASAMPMVDPSPAVLAHAAPAAAVESVRWGCGPYGCHHWGPGRYWHRPWGWHRHWGWHRPWGWHRGYGWHRGWGWHHRWHRW